MAPRIGCVAAALLLLALVVEGKVTTKLLGHFKAPHAAFVGISQNKHHTDVRDQFTVMVAGFNAIPFTSDHVYQVKQIGRHLGDVSSIRPTLITSKVTWPNEVDTVSQSIFDKEMVSVSGGFLVPMKTHGSISLYDTSSEPPKGPYYITSNRGSDSSWFYHRIIWKDMDGDGDMDVLTARAQKPILGGAKGELLWYENPGKPFSQEFQKPWTAHVLAIGPDVYFRDVTLSTPSGDVDAIITAGFFSEKITIFWTTDPGKKWTVRSQLHSRVIESKIGAIFDLQHVDMNNDGKKDLLVTTNKQNNAALYVYEIPDDFRTGTFKQHVLASGFSAKFNLFGRSGALGSAYAIHEPMSSKKRPIIIMSGDDDGKAYLLESNSEAATNWAYTQTAFLTTGSDTVGEIAYADVNGDGHLELFVPDYNKGVVYVYSLTSS